MLELKQMELTDYEDIKQAVRQSMTKAVVSFVEIGFYLKKIKSEQLYLKDGYKDIWEVAEAEFGLKRKQAWSFMNINDKYSVDGNSTELLQQYEGFSKSTLTEMLTLPDEDYELITENTRVEDIRELKQAEQEHAEEVRKEEEQVPGQTSIVDMMPDAVPEQDKKPTMEELSKEDAIKRLFRPKEMRVSLNNLCSLYKDSKELEYWVESFNPSGNRMEKVMPYFIFFYKYEDGVKIKNIVTQEITAYTYLEFCELVRKIFGSIGAMADYWTKEFGQLEAAELKENAVSGEKEEYKNKEIVSEEEENKQIVRKETVTLNKNAASGDLEKDENTDIEDKNMEEQNQDKDLESQNEEMREKNRKDSETAANEMQEGEVLRGEVEETAGEKPVGDIAQKLVYDTTKEVMKRIGKIIKVPSWKTKIIRYHEYEEIRTQGQRYLWGMDEQLYTGDLVRLKCQGYPDIPVMILNYSNVPNKNGGKIYGFEIIDDEMEYGNE